MKKDSLLYTTIFTAISAFIFVFLLSLAYGATKEKVEQNNKLIEAKAYLMAAGVSVTEDMEIESEFDKLYPGFDSDNLFQETTINGQSIIVSPFQDRKSVV